METKVTTPVVKGLIISLILIVFGLVLYFTDQYMNKTLSYIQYAIILGGIIWGCITYSNQLNNNVTFGNLFAHGFKITAVFTVILVVYTILSLKVLFPEMADKILEQTTAELEKQNMSEEQIDQAMSITKKFFVPFAIGGVLVGYMFIGAISSLLGAAIAKKNPQDPFVQQG